MSFIYGSPLWVALSIILVILTISAATMLLTYLTGCRKRMAFLISSGLTALGLGVSLILIPPPTVAVQATVAEELGRISDLSGNQIDPIEQLNIHEKIIAGTTADMLRNAAPEDQVAEFLSLVGVTSSIDTKSTLCHELEPSDDFVVMAFFCPQQPSTIFFNKSAAFNDSRSQYIEIARHELAHRSILLRCGIPANVHGKRTVDITRNERITEAYAKMFLGSSDQPFHPGILEEYLPDTSDFATAQAIYEGDCTIE